MITLNTTLYIIFTAHTNLYILNNSEMFTTLLINKHLFKLFVEFYFFTFAKFLQVIFQQYLTITALNTRLYMIYIVHNDL